MAYQTNTTKYEYAKSLRDFADTKLYEMAQDIILQTRKDATSGNEPCHWQNSLLYQEFWERGKAEAYYHAYKIVDNIVREAGKPPEMGSLKMKIEPSIGMQQ